MKKIKSNIIERIITLIAGAFALVSALAWNDAIKSLFVGPCSNENAGFLCTFSTGGPFIYAVLVTIFAVIITIWITKFLEKSI